MHDPIIRRLPSQTMSRSRTAFQDSGNQAKISSLDVLNTMLYVVENECKWRGLPKKYGDSHMIYVRVNRLVSSKSK